MDENKKTPLKIPGKITKTKTEFSYFIFVLKQLNSAETILIQNVTPYTSNRQQKQNANGIVAVSLSFI